MVSTDSGNRCVGCYVVFLRLAWTPFLARSQRSLTILTHYEVFSVNEAPAAR